MATLPAAALNGGRILVLGGDIAVIEPVVSRLEDWGAAPLVLFDVPSAMNALVRARPYLVVLDSSFGSDLSGLLSVLQGDRALPADARRSIPTLLLTGPNTPPLETVLGPGLDLDAMRNIRTVRYDQPLAVETALREALQVAGLSSYAPLAFTPPQPATLPSRPAVPVPIPVPVPAAQRPDRRATPILFALALLALLAVPGVMLFTRLSSSRPTAQPAPTVRAAATTTPGTPLGATPGTVPGTTPGTVPGTPTSSAGTAGTAANTPSAGAPTAAPGSTAPASTAGIPTLAPGATPTAAPAPLNPLVDPLRNLLGPLLGQPPAAAQPGVAVPPASSGSGSAPGAPGAPTIRPLWQPPTAPRLPFCGAVEQWRPLVRETLSDAWNEARLDGPAGALDDDLVLALILRESTGDPRALNTGGAEEVGLLQLLPTTFAEQLARSINESPASLTQAMQDPRANLRAGVRYLARAFASQSGDLYWSLVAYRAGLEGAAAWRRAGGTPIEIDARIRATLETYARHRPDVRLVFVPSPGAPAPMTVRPVLSTGSC